MKCSLSLICYFIIYFIGVASKLTAAEVLKDVSIQAKDLSNCLGICQCNWSIGLVDCSDLDLNEVPTYLPKEVKILLLSSNKITRIKGTDFRSLLILEAIYLDDNFISSIDDDSFEFLSGIRVLDLSNNMLTDWSANLTHSAKNSLQILNLSKNNLQEIKRVMFGSSMPHLIELNLEQTAIRSIEDGAFFGLTALKILNLNINIISYLNPNGSTLEGLKELQELYLEANFFSTLPDLMEFKYIRQSLVILSFAGHSRVKSLPRFDLPALQILNMSFCGLQSLENFTFEYTPNLTTLDVQANFIGRIESRAFSGLQYFKDINFSQNNLVGLPYNALSTVSASLKSLNANYLPLRFVRSTLTTSNIPLLSKLEYLSLEHTFLSRIDADSFFQNLQNLKTLRLSFSQITTVPREPLSFLTSLQSFVFNGNPITNLTTTSFPTLQSLRYLEINKSPQLVNIEDNSFTEIKQALAQIAINSGTLQQISRNAFQGLDRLESLDISNNRLEIIYPDWITDNLQSLKLSGNQLRCDCNLTEFKQWLYSEEYQNINNTDTPTCYFPRSMRGLPISKVQESELTCEKPSCPEMCLCFEQKRRNTNVVESFSTIASVDCSNEGLSEISFELPPSTLRLTLNDNKLSSLRKENFQNMKTVQKLFASNNEIFLLENDTFRIMHDLQELDLHENKIELLPRDLLKNLTQLETLRLDSNWIQIIDPENFADLENLLTLDISENNLKILDTNVFAGLHSLSSLVLDSNSISVISADAFTPLKSLKSLYLNNNPINALHPDLFTNLPFLHNLEISKTRISHLSSSFLLSDSIAYLKIEGAGVQNITGYAFTGLSNLHTIRIRGNYISDISDNAFALTDDSSINMITTLDLSRNSLAYFPLKALSSLESLTNLYIGYNPIINLNSVNLLESSTYLSSLVTLDLAYTEISELSELSVFNSFPNLENLVMNNCKFTQVPTITLMALPELKTLILDGNQIEELNEMSFRSHMKLQYFSLRFDEQLTSIKENTFSELPNLSTLHLSNGGLTYIGASAFKGLSNLQVLDISGNSLSIPLPDWFNDLEPYKLVSVSMHNNPWQCDCEALPYKNWLLHDAEAFNAYTLSISCSEPFYIKGKSVETVNSAVLCGTYTTTEESLHNISTNIVSSTTSFFVKSDPVTTSKSESFSTTNSSPELISINRSLGGMSIFIFLFLSLFLQVDQ